MSDVSFVWFTQEDGAENRESQRGPYRVRLHELAGKPGFVFFVQERRFQPGDVLESGEGESKSRGARTGRTEQVLFL